MGARAGGDAGSPGGESIGETSFRIAAARVKPPRARDDGGRAESQRIFPRSPGVDGRRDFAFASIFDITVRSAPEVMACVATAPPSVARAPRVVGLAPRKEMSRLPHPRGHDRSAHAPTRFRLLTRESRTRVLANKDDSDPPSRLVDPSRKSASGLGASGSKSAPACARCDDTGLSPCRACRGSGALSPGGFHAKNHVDLRSVVGTNWTAHVRTEGWRHFEAVETRPADKKGNPPRLHASVRLTATCDRAVSVWVSVKDLKDRVKWSAGWKQREELAWTGDADSALGAVAVPKRGPVCPKCSGDKVEVCVEKKCVAGSKKRREKEKNETVIRETTARARRAVKAARKKAEEEGDADAAAYVGRAKKTIKVVGEAKRSKRERRRAARLGANDDDEGAGTGSSNGEEDWGALARARRDEKLEAFVRGVKNTEGPESRQ